MGGVWGAAGLISTGVGMQLGATAFARPAFAGGGLGVGGEVGGWREASEQSR